MNPGQFEERSRELEKTHTREQIDNYTTEFKNGAETVRFSWDGGDGYEVEEIKADKKAAKKAAK